MKKTKKLLTSTVVTTAVAALLSTPVLATTINTQGGTWNYGVGSKYVWSYYSHKHKTHKSSVQGKYYSTSGWTRKGVKAKASAEKAKHGNRSYFDVQ